MKTKIVSIGGGNVRIWTVAAALAFGLGCGPVQAKDLVVPDSREVYVGHGRTACDGSAEDCANNRRNTNAVEGRRDSDYRDKSRHDSDRRKSSHDNSKKSHKDSDKHRSHKDD